MDDSLLNFVLRMFAEHVITLTDAVVRAKEVNCTEKKKRKTRKKEKKKPQKNENETRRGQRCVVRTDGERGEK